MAIGLERGFQFVTGVSIRAVEVYFEPASKEAADSPEGRMMPAFFASLISRRISASDGAPEAM